MIKIFSFTYTLSFLLISLVLIFLRLLPLNHLTTDWPVPDLILCVMLAWCLRFPASAPIILLGFLFLIQDVLFQRPIGLFAASAFLLCEWCKRQSIQAVEFPFLEYEWDLDGVKSWARNGKMLDENGHFIVEGTLTTKMKLV